MSEKKTNQNHSMQKGSGKSRHYDFDNPKNWIYATGQSCITPFSLSLLYCLKFPIRYADAYPRRKIRKYPPHIQDWFEVLLPPDVSSCYPFKLIIDENRRRNRKQTAKVTGKETGELNAEVSAGASAEVSAGSSDEVSAGASAEVTGKGTGKETGEKTGKETGEETGKETGKQIGEEADKEIDEETGKEISKEKALNNVLKNLENVISDLKLANVKTKEIENRFDTLKLVWLEDKLNNVICKNLLDLSTALREGNVDKADDIYVLLMMQYADLCSEWIPGIRSIILELKTRKKSSNVTQS